MTSAVVLCGFRVTVSLLMLGSTTSILIAVLEGKYCTGRVVITRSLATKLSSRNCVDYGKVQLLVGILFVNDAMGKSIQQWVGSIATVVDACLESRKAGNHQR